MALTGELRAENRFGGVLRFGFALGFGVFAEALLYASPVGWLYAVFAAAMIAAILIFGEAQAYRSPAMMLALAGVVALAVEPHWASFLLAFLGILSLALAGQADVAGDAWRWVRSIAVFTLMLPGMLLLSLAGGSQKLQVPNLPRSVWYAAKQWIVPLFIASVFLALFAQANPLIADGTRSVFNFLFGGGGFSLIDLFTSAARIIVIALLCWPLLRSPELHIPDREASVLREPLSLGVTLRSLILCNILFGVQNVLDLIVLWGGGGLPEAMSFSEYAHRGTYPLALAAVLVGLFVLVALPAGGAVERDRRARMLTFFWLGQTALLTLSCLKRLDLYVSAYSLSYMRVFAITVTALIGIGLILICLRLILRRSNRWLVTQSALIGLGLLFAGSTTDVGSRIAWFNVEHSREVGGPGAHLDIVYLRRAVGPSALPALAWFAENRIGFSEDTRRTRQSNRLAATRAALTQEFAETMTDWRAWTLRRGRLQSALLRLDE